MKSVVLTVPGISYPVFIGADAAITEQISTLIAGRELMVVTDANVAPHYLEPMCAALGAAARIETCVLPAGESEKTLAGFERVTDALVGGCLHRDAIVIALGGGVIGDLAGFAAACYQRGVAWIVVPTTLLAQVDAALGGKTAINHPAGKNLIGAFHDPLAVWIDAARLAALPAREYRAGLGEVVKYGLGFDAAFFAWLEENAAALLAREKEALADAIPRCIRLKLEVVAADRTERGARALLNLGHTIGHALETALGYGVWLHGEAVAVGLVAAAELSAARGALASEIPARLRRLLQALELPTSVPPEAADAALNKALALDKKIAAGRLRFIGLAALGRAEIWNNVESVEIERAIAATRVGCEWGRAPQPGLRGDLTNGV
ncbi:MAG: 3-dehydroquinate synthase [Gammaproteobacteria bacterium]